MVKRTALTQKRRNHIAALYQEGASMKDLSEEFNHAIATIRRVLTDADIPIRLHGTPVKYTPTPKEIEEETAKIRAGWREQEYKNHRTTQSAHVPMSAINDRHRNGQPPDLEDLA